MKYIVVTKYCMDGENIHTHFWKCDTLDDANSWLGKLVKMLKPHCDLFEVKIKEHA